MIQNIQQDAYSYKGLMLDVGRYFFPKEDVKKVIDYMDDLKLNVLHLHLTEDQGWRMQIDKYPLLTEVGSMRKSTNFSLKPHGGFYTKADLKEIVDYSHSKNIIVIPEFDIPGHTRAAIAAYPELACLKRKLPVAHWWGVKHDILCAGNEFVYTFIKDVIDEITEIFTDGYIHLGGDEAVKTRWKLCPKCQKVIKENGLKDEDDLQTYFINRIVREIILPKGVKPIIWACENIPEELDENIILEWYSNGKTSNKDKQVLEKHPIITANSDYLYFDFPHSMNTLDECFMGDYNEGLPNTVFGAEVCLWTEYIKDINILEKRAFPRIIAASEKFNGHTLSKEELYDKINAYYLSHENDNFTSIKSANNKSFRAIRNIPWKYLRALHWEGLQNELDNLKVKIIFKRKSKK